MNPYFEQMILSASPIELVRLLYRKAIGCVQDARLHLRNGLIMERCTSINTAWSILMELSNSLHPAEGGDQISQNLRRLYIYMQERLVVANLKQQDEPLAEVLGLLVTLSEAWNNISEASPVPAQSARMGGMPAGSPYGVQRMGASEEEPVRIAVSA